jgi:formylmethanofuran dehydrogenase subunit E
MERDIDHEYTEEITCPHCGEIFTDSWEYSDSGTHTCYECKGKFAHERNISIDYTTSKVE